MRLEQILDMLGNETRREILQLLSERPCYVSELSQELNIGQKAIIEHLELMRDAGILEARFKKIEKGRPRKYYLINQDLLLEVRIGQDLFKVETLSLSIDDKVLDAFPKLKRITEELDEVQSLQGEEKIHELRRIYDELQYEKKNINEAKKIVEYLLGQIRNTIREEEIDLFF
jgi:ArsR family transcriptional regulator